MPQISRIAQIQSLLWALTSAGFAFAGDDIASAVAGLQGRYGSVNIVTADFQQTYRAPGVEIVESGTVWMKKPGMMRWEYRVPEKKLFIADGRETYLYIPEDRQVMVRAFGTHEMQGTPLMFLLGRGDISKNFDVSWERELKPRFEGTLLLRLSPNSVQSDYSHVVLEFAADSFDLRRIVVRERSGNTSEFQFSNLEMNKRIENKQFEFRIPKGVEVIRVDEKN